MLRVLFGSIAAAEAVLLTRSRSPWLLSGAVAMFLAAALSAQAFWLGSEGEPLLLLGLHLTTTRRAPARNSPADAA